MTVFSHCRPLTRVFLLIVIVIFELCVGCNAFNGIHASTSRLLEGSKAKRVAETAPYRRMVKHMFYDAFDAYLAYAYPSDELRPLSCRGTGSRATEHGVPNLFMGNWSRTLVDALDTLYVIGDWAEFEHAVFAVAETVPAAMKAAEAGMTRKTISLFETTIRVIGGLLSAHMIAARNINRFSKDHPYNNELLDAAETVAQRIAPAFFTKTGVPCATIGNDGIWDCLYDTTTIADAGSLVLEWRTLARLTGKPIYSKYVDHTLAVLRRIRSPLGLLAERLSWKNLSTYGLATVGPGIDSYIEYLLKGYALFGDKNLFDEYKSIINSVYRSQYYHGSFIPAHPVTGEFVLDRAFSGLQFFWPILPLLEGDIEKALETYISSIEVVSLSLLQPDAYHVSKQNLLFSDASFPLRPEFIEATYSLYKVTHDPVFVNIGIVQAEVIRRFCHIPCGAAGVSYVTLMNLTDRMDSFYLSETLKYLYLLFDEENEFNSGHVFTTEAHPFPECSPLYKDYRVRIPGLEKEICPPFPRDLPLKFESLFRKIDAGFIRMYQRVFLDNTQVRVTMMSSVYGAMNFTAYKSSFGLETFGNVHRGSFELLTTTPLDACTRLKKQPTKHHKGYAAFIDRGTCSFEDKILNAKRNGASLVLIGDVSYEGPIMMGKMHISDEEASNTIPALSVTKVDGDHIKKWLSQGSVHIMLRD